MSEEISKSRSPNAPGISLEQALATVQKLYKAIVNASVPAEVAAQSLNYSGMNGAALTTLGALSAYDLIDRVKGKVGVSSTARTILHPMSEDARKEALRKAALEPRIFTEIHEQLHNCAPNVLENFLIHQDFTPERAKKVAAVYAQNAAFANLAEAHNVEEPKDKTDSDEEKKPLQSNPRQNRAAPDPNEERNRFNDTTSSKKMLAQYTIPLGANEATLAFTGTELTADDFDALIDFVTFSKRQFERALKSSSSAKSRALDEGKEKSQEGSDDDSDSLDWMKEQ